MLKPAVGSVENFGFDKVGNIQSHKTGRDKTWVLWFVTPGRFAVSSPADPTYAVLTFAPFSKPKAGLNAGRTPIHNTMRIIFFGTPDFAVAALRVLLETGHDVAAVVTAPDKPAGRGQQLSESAVKKFAVAHNLPVLQPEKLKNPEFLDTLRELAAELHVVVAFRMLPEAVWALPPRGTINVHGSLLPQYRGAAPINWAIINGEAFTGVTTFQLQQEIDTGGVLLQKETAILPEDDFGTLYQKLMEQGAALLAETVQELTAGTLHAKPQPQHPAGLRHAPKIFKADCELDFSQSAEAVHNKVRGLSPFPTAFTFLDGKNLRIFKSRFETVKEDTPLPPPATPQTDSKTYLRFACADGWLYARELQLEGKKRMTVGDFLRGYRF